MLSSVLSLLGLGSDDTSTSDSPSPLSRPISPMSSSAVFLSGCTHLPHRDVLLPRYRQLVVANTRTVYVSALTGSDSNDGTSAHSFASISRAIHSAQPGDRVLVSNGVYGYLSIYQFQGSPTAWLSVEAAPSQTPIIDVANASHSTGNGIDIQASAYVGVFGFEIHANACQANSDSSGIGVFQRSSHIVNWAHHIHSFPGGGVNHFYANGGWDVVDVSYNAIHDCCKYSVYNTSGISFYGAVDTTKGQTWEDHYAYRAVGNYLYSCICLVPYTPGGFDSVTDGNGLSVDSLNTANSLHPDVVPYFKPGRLDSNLVVGCGGRGVHVYNSINVDLSFNTLVGNIRTTSPNITGGCDADATFYPKVPPQPNVNYYGCVLLPLNTPNTTVSTASYQHCVIAGGTQPVPDGNVDRRAVGVKYLVGKPSLSDVIAGADPTLLRPVVADEVDPPSIIVPFAYTALGISPRPTEGKWTAGALEA